MYIASTLITIAAWFLGLILDVNVGSKPDGFLYLRVLFPVLAMGLCILKAVKDSRKN